MGFSLGLLFLLLFVGSSITINLLKNLNKNSIRGSTSIKKAQSAYSSAVAGALQMNVPTRDNVKASLQRANGSVESLNQKIQSLRDNISFLSRRNAELEERAKIGSYLMLLPRGDGFGTHVFALLHALAYCRFKNLTYIHVPWTSVGHTPAGTKTEDWSSDLEDFIGLVKDEIRWKSDLGPIPAINWIGKVEEKIETYFNDDFLTSMRQMYFASPKNNSQSFATTDNTIRVAVHIRRGDIEGHDGHKFRYTTNNETLAFMKLVENELRKSSVSKPVSFHIYSEGNPESFNDIQLAYGERVFLHLNENIKVTFHDLVSSDVLIIAKSSFSYSAALLSKASVYFQRFWMAPRHRWHELVINT